MKKCPFCGESILDEAIKCRFCGEFLSPLSQSAVPEAGSSPLSVDPRNPTTAFEVDKEFFFAGNPSLVALVDTFAVALVLLGLAGFIGYYFYQTYGLQIGLILAGVVVIAVTAKILIYKCTIYRITSDRLEFEKGVFSKRVDNVDLFRIVDLRLTQSLVDRLFGIGTIELVTTDENQPRCELYKIRTPRRVYEVLKKASLTADRRRGVLHLE